MAETTGIEWADRTWNPWLGCTKVSPACDHCYAEAWAKRTGSPELWAGKRRRTSTSYWRKAFRYNADAVYAGRRLRVFPSLCDPFDNQVPDEWRADLWATVSATQNLDWLLLTKRPQNIEKMLPPTWGAGWPNVWLGTTTENQEEADRRIPHLLAVPAAKRFLSCEPLLGLINLHSLPNTHSFGEGQRWLNALKGYVYEYDDTCAAPSALDWVIAGGESGPNRRPMSLTWAHFLRDQCRSDSVAFFMKQIDKKTPIPADLLVREFPA